MGKEFVMLEKLSEGLHLTESLKQQHITEKIFADKTCGLL